MHNYHQLSIYCWLLHWIIQCVTLAAFPLLPTASQSFDPFDNAADKAPLGPCSIKASTFGTVICCPVSKWVCLKMAMFMLG